MLDPREFLGGQLAQALEHVPSWERDHPVAGDVIASGKGHTKGMVAEQTFGAAQSDLLGGAVRLVRRSDN